MGSTKPPSLSVGSVYSRIKKVQRRTQRISRSKVLSHWSGLRMNTASPTILRTRHKFGDYLSQPDLAKFELPKKMSRPWIVNNAFEQEKLKDLIVTERPVEASLVMRQIKKVDKKEKNSRDTIRSMCAISTISLKRIKRRSKKVKRSSQQKSMLTKRGNICYRNKWGLGPVHKMTQHRLCPTTWLPQRTTWRETRKKHNNLLKRTSSWSSRG